MPKTQKVRGKKTSSRNSKVRSNSGRARLVLPTLHLGAEYLVQGYLMRRNVLAYKAPPHNKGYDLICIHPDPRSASRPVRIQVKSRYATDCDRGVPVKSRSFEAFDFLVIVFQNIGYFFRRAGPREGVRDPEFYTLPAAFVRKHHDRIGKGWETFRTHRLNLERYKNERGFELIARKLRIPYPSKQAVRATDKKAVD